jgi:glycopeptide antibiotics resistance protein
MLSVIILILIYLIIYFKKWKNYKGAELIFRKLMFVYICFVLFLTILPIDWTFDPKWKYHTSIEFSYGNIKPFNDLILGRSGSIKEVVLNIMMTIPFGFLYSILKRKLNFIKVIISTFLFSLSIEVAQLMMTIFLLKYRSFDVTDLISNTIGGILGYYIYIKLSKQQE